MSATPAQRLAIVDSHTGGEPTRLVISGGPDLGPGDLATRARVFGEKFDPWRSAIVNEPRGSDVLVGALLVEPSAPGCSFGVIYFNNVGLLGMCGHGTIGLVRSLQHLGRLQPGVVRIDTPVGPVTAELAADGTVSIENVPSYRQAAKVVLEVTGIGQVTGDVAWGGNWFFLAAQSPLELELRNLAALTDYTTRVRQAANTQGFPAVDHVELFGPGRSGGHSRNFVLCPGGAYDRSPCGTGTSAKLACLAADGKLGEGEEWIQESIVGSIFRGRYRREGDKIIPSISGTAHVTGEGVLRLDPSDPFRWGIR
ncbi:MAG TPA: proline racemase family protein [Candidatus Didemnitutus sp.]|nr:proline racemase family protein [Candidatus Didemnitutus sp.]